MVVFARFALLVAAIALTACGSTLQPRSPHPTTSLTPVELIAQAEALQGRRVAVRGYFTYGVDTRALWESEAAYRDARDQRLGTDVDYWAKCVTIYPDGVRARPFNERPVVISGKVVIIDKDDIRSLWTCNAVALEDAAVSRR